MKARLIIRCSKEREYKPFVQYYPKLKKTWITEGRLGFVTVLKGDLDDPEFQELHSYLKRKVKYIYSDIDRKYTSKELNNAELLAFYASSQIEPTGEQCGTEYFFSCDKCGTRALKDNKLILNLSKIPKGKDTTETIASDEWIVSERVKSLIDKHKIKGAELYPVEHWRKASISKKWYYVKTNSVIKISDQTTFGEPYRQGPLSMEQAPKSTCGHAIICEPYSEYYLEHKSWDGSDIVHSNWIFGYHPQGRLIFPSPQIFISGRFFKILIQNNIKGFFVDVARLV